MGNPTWSDTFDYDDALENHDWVAYSGGGFVGYNGYASQATSFASQYMYVEYEVPLNLRSNECRVVYNVDINKTGPWKRVGIPNRYIFTVIQLALADDDSIFLIRLYLNSPGEELYLAYNDPIRSIKHYLYDDGQLSGYNSVGANVIKMLAPYSYSGIIEFKLNNSVITFTYDGMEFPLNDLDYVNGANVTIKGIQIRHSFPLARSLESYFGISNYFKFNAVEYYNYLGDVDPNEPVEDDEPEETIVHDTTDPISNYYKFEMYDKGKDWNWRGEHGVTPGSLYVKDIDIQLMLGHIKKMGILKYRFLRLKISELPEHILLNLSGAEIDPTSIEYNRKIDTSYNIESQIFGELLSFKTEPLTVGNNTHVKVYGGGYKFGNKYVEAADNDRYKIQNTAANSNYIIKSGAISGTFLNDLTHNDKFNKILIKNCIVKVVSTSPDNIIYSSNSGRTWSDDIPIIPKIWIPIGQYARFKFNSSFDHSVGDIWRFNDYNSSDKILYSGDGKNDLTFKLRSDEALADHTLDIVHVDVYRYILKVESVNDQAYRVIINEDAGMLVLDGVNVETPGSLYIPSTSLIDLTIVELDLSTAGVNNYSIEVYPHDTITCSLKTRINEYEDWKDCIGVLTFDNITTNPDYILLNLKYEDYEETPFGTSNIFIDAPLYGNLKFKINTQYDIITPNGSGNYLVTPEYKYVVGDEFTIIPQSFEIVHDGTGYGSGVDISLLNNSDRKYEERRYSLYIIDTVPTDNKVFINLNRITHRVSQNGEAKNIPLSPIIPNYNTDYTNPVIIPTEPYNYFPSFFGIDMFLQLSEDNQYEIRIPLNYKKINGNQVYHGLFPKQQLTIFTIQITGVNGQTGYDQFSWSLDGGNTWEQTNIDVSLEYIELEYELAVKFDNTTGHVIGDAWEIYAIASGENNLILIGHNQNGNIIEHSLGYYDIDEPFDFSALDIIDNNGWSIPADIIPSSLIVLKPTYEYKDGYVVGKLNVNSISPDDIYDIRPFLSIGATIGDNNMNKPIEYMNQVMDVDADINHDANIMLKYRDDTQTWKPIKSIHTASTIPINDEVYKSMMWIVSSDLAVLYEDLQPYEHHLLICIEIIDVINGRYGIWIDTTTNNTIGGIDSNGTI